MNVFKNTSKLGKDFFKTSVPNGGDKTKKNLSMLVKFKKSMIPLDNCQIDIKDFKHYYYYDKNNVPQIYLFVFDYDLVKYLEIKNKR